MARQSLKPVLKFLQVAGLMLVEVHRVQAECGVQAILLQGQIPKAFPVVPVNPEQYQSLHAQCAALGEHPGAVAIEVGEVQVGVGIDQAHRASVGLTPGFGKCRYKTPRLDRGVRHQWCSRVARNFTSGQRSSIRLRLTRVGAR